ncbi:ATP-binding protein [Streptomyces sp. NPDC089799]|uniref:ATP-binding protein n=1 Tax=Streptomyces sp. NPDC089799 TaxID=3155066 RepID=UPI00341CFE2F
MPTAPTAPGAPTPPASPAATAATAEPCVPAAAAAAAIVPVAGPAGAAGPARRIVLPHSVAAVPMARALVRNTLAEAGQPADGDTAELLTAELVANAVQHARGEGPIEIVVEVLPDGCQVEVHDGDPVDVAVAVAPALPAGRAPDGHHRQAGRHPDRHPDPHAHPDPHPEAPDPWQEGGRGLFLIRALSSSCGQRPTDRGKAVWFTLPTLRCTV